MRINDFKFNSVLKAAILVAVILMVGAGASFAQQQVNLTAAPTTTTLPDGTTVQMWGYTCHALAAGVASTATCAALNPNAPPTALGTPGWSPVVITVPVGAAGGLQINLTNNLSFTPTGATTANSIPTSIVIMGQVGGGLGQVSQRTTTQSPSHTDAQGCVTWFIANTTPGVPCTTSTPLASPPVQGPRVQSWATEVWPAGATVSAGETGTPCALSGGACTLTWPNLRPGTYLLESGTHPSIQVPMGLIGMLVVTTAPTTTSALGTAYPGTTNVPAVQYNAEVPLEFSEIDPVQNNAVNTAVNTAGFSETAVWTKMNAPVGLSALSVTNPGSGYTGPLAVSFTGGGSTGSGAAASATLTFNAATVASGGTGYTQGDLLTLVGGTGTPATATVSSVSGGIITGVTLTSPGNYSVYPTNPVGVTDATTSTASGATLNATGFISGVTLTSAGQGYTSAPIVQVSGATGTGAMVTASVTLGGCGTTNTCYPPAVNYTPFYYLINGVAFNKTSAGASMFAATAGVDPITGLPVKATNISGTVLARLVNAGLRMHVPSIVGSLTQGFSGAGAASTVSGFTLIAEDGNVIPGVAPAGATTAAPVAPRVQTHVFMAAGKVYDVLLNVPTCTPATGTTTCTPPALPVYARDLSLSANSSERDAGMLAYIGVNGATLPAVGTAGTVFAAAKANADTYNSVAACASTATSCIPLVISDVSKGVIANDINVYGVNLLTLPTKGTLTCTSLGTGLCANGTFTYTPNPGFPSAGDSFTYCANTAFVPATSTTAASCTSAALTATVTLGPSGLSGSLSAIPQTYTAQTASFIKVPSPGLLLGNTDPNNLSLSVVVPSTAPTFMTSGVSGTPTVVMDANGGFALSLPGNTKAGIVSFTYNVQNSLGAQSSNSATVTVNFPTPSLLAVNVLDAQAYNNCNGDSTCIAALVPILDYRWIIEEDKTFWVDPNCTTNSSATTVGCPAIVGPTGQSTIPTFGVNFHTSNMDYVAQGCTGALSCEGGQTMLDNRQACTAPGVPAGCSTTAGSHIPAVCDVGNGACRPDPTGNGFTPVMPSSVHLDPTKRYYISVLPGDAGNPFPTYAGQPGCDPVTGAQTTATGGNPCGHTMSGAPIPPSCNILVSGCTSASTAAFAPVNVLTLPTPLPTGKLSIMVFEDDFPLNGEQDGGGGVDVVSAQEPGLGGFNLVLWDTYGGLGDVTGQDTYDMFNQPLSNSLAGTVDPATGLDACPISASATTAPINTGAGPGAPPAGGITGMIVTCPKYESDGKTLSPLAGQAVVANLMPEKFSVQAYPGADRIARGEEWIQTNTLDGQHPHDSFIRIGEPSYFQEYGPAGYHVSIGFANPAIINARHDAVCAGNYGAVGDCSNSIKGQVDVQRLSRTPDQRLYPSGSRDALAWTQCWVSLGDPDAEDFMFTKCDAEGNFAFNLVPGGNWRLTIGDQWNDQIIDGLSTPANVGCILTPPATACPAGTITNLDMGKIGVQQWQSNLYTKTCIDDNKNGICDSNEIGIPLIYTRIRYRDGHNSNSLTTDFNGVANFNETFPLFNWYVVESDPTRYKTTGIHTVYDAGGPADGSTSCGTTSNPNGPRPCGTSGAYNFLANTYEAVPLPADLSVPGAAYCASADCAAEAGVALPGSAPSAGTFQAGAMKASSSTASTGRLDPPWVSTEGWSGMTSQGNWIEFAKAPYAPGENGGIKGFVDYASTRPFDSAEQMIQQPWEPWVPHVTINLYQEGVASDNVTPTLTLVDTTQTSSWDDWAQGFYPNPTSGTPPKPYMSCPGQGTATGANADLFYYTLFDQPNFLDWYNSEHNGGTQHPLPYNSQFKCYDAMHVWNQIQPAPVDGEYSFPSSLGIDATTGKPNITLTGGVGGNGPGTPGFKSASMAGTNCTVCVANPTHAGGVIDESYDPYRAGTPMLPPGKYVVEVIMPQGYEVYKEEDKNLLIGDNYIAPTTQQFAGLGGDIFIIPDQANVASLYDPNNSGYNPNNFQNQTTGLGLQGGMLSGVPGFPGFTDPVWPCVGEMRTVPDYLSLFPQVKEVAPFAGATRPLCDRKEVTLSNQLSVNAKFAIYTSTHIASKFTGVITDDFTSEFDPFAPQFGEKFAPPNMPISTRDYLGNEISRVYSDHFGIYDGLTFSSWEVNPPNITGYSPTIMVQCMNDAGPIPDGKGGWMTDPLYNPAYSNFCYEEPYMPGLTTYLDTPVVPTQAFVGAGYNNADCAYPDATPAIAEVDGDGAGPWVSAFTNTLTIAALGNQTVNDYGYAGPSASAAPFNLKTVTRHYGFGTQCTSPTAGSATCNTMSSVTIGGVPATLTGTGWSDTQIQVSVPSGVPACTIQQQPQYANNGSGPNYGTAYCGQLVITAGNGRQSIDAVTVTIGGKQPVHVAATATIQSAIDAAAPGDLIIVDPTCATGSGSTATTVPCTTTGATKTAASHTEMLIMWKPVRLQGVGAASTIINANTHPAGKLLDAWRRHINCLFGLTLQGSGMNGTNAYDSTGVYKCPDAGWNLYTASTGLSANPQIDRLPSEAVVGWDATLNGNLAELLQEPSLMGAYEGAGITVLAKGVEMHGGNPWDQTLEGAFPTGSNLLTGVTSDPTSISSTFSPAPSGSTYAATSTTLVVGDGNPLCHTVTYNADGTVTRTADTNPYPSNYVCNPSSIDGLSVTNSSQGGGGMFVHGWAHFLEIANNRVYNNAGTLSGGITDGQGEFGPPNIVGGGLANLPPGSCSDGTGFVTNQHEPWCLQVHTSLHNNMITDNSSIGDELFSATLSGGGGATVCTGSDYYRFNYNWVCGNLSAGEGGGMVHLGEIQNGDIERNAFVFNQSSNPTIPTNGGGIQVMGTPDTDPVCPGVPDTDCPSGLSDGTGHGLLINANRIQGNSADSGSGGGIRLQHVNGTEVPTFSCPTIATNPPCVPRPDLWNDVTITNNIIVNNMAGWDGAGISLQDALNVNIINNTVAHNDSLASSGVLTQSIGTPQASAPAGECHNAAGTASCPQSAGLTSTSNSTLLRQAVTGLAVTCPPGHTGCTGFSNPILYNDIFWQNRSFYIGVGGLGAGGLNQQNLVSLYSAFTNTLAPAQTFTGECSPFPAGSYWDVGVRGDTGPANHSSGLTLRPVNSLLTRTTGGYNGASSNNTAADPAVVAEYCNGSRVPPECTLADGCGGPHGFGVPPGIADAVTPNPVFSLVPSATVDEGNNWINVSWGPLSLTNPSVTGGASNNYGGGAPLGNYTPQSFSPVIDYVPCGTGSTSTSCVVAPAFAGLPAIAAPLTDFFGMPRPNPDADGHIDIGAIELQGAHITAPGPTLTSISPSQGTRGSVVSVVLSGTNLAGATINTPIAGITVSNVTSTPNTVTANFAISGGAVPGPRNVSVTTPGGTSNAVTFYVGPYLTGISPNTGLAGTSVPVTLTGTTLAAATGVNVSGGGGVTATITGTPTDTSVAATITIPAGAAATARNVTVTTAGGAVSNSVTFTVLRPTLTSISPTSGVRGTSVSVTFTGTGLTGVTSGNAPGQPNITVTNVVAANDTTVTATLNLAPGTALGDGHTITVSNSGGATSNPVNFTVTGATLAFSGPTPALTTTPANTTTKSGLVTITNSGTGSFTFTAAPGVTKVSGPVSGTFTIIGGTCSATTILATTGPGSSCTIQVQYAPGGSTAGASAHVTVTGTGLASAGQNSGNFPAN